MYGTIQKNIEVKLDFGQKKTGIVSEEEVNNTVALLEDSLSALEEKNT